MLNTRKTFRYRKNLYLHKRIKTVSLVIISFFFITISIIAIIRINSSINNERRELLRVWNVGEYELAYEISKKALELRPMDYFFLTMNGFSAYQLGISQINNQNMLRFIDESIFSLRKAMLHNAAKTDARIYYVLGKAYHNKGIEYSDLAIKYLSMAEKLSYDASDIPEYLGLAYAASGDYRSSVAAFSQAFIKNETPKDNLILSIARSYISLNEYNMAMSYLKRCIDSSPDSNSVVLARSLLAEIFINLGEFENAEEQYLIILSESGENADTRFLLGELYNLQGNTIRARAEWRLAVRLDPAHARARARL